MALIEDVVAAHTPAYIRKYGTKVLLKQTDTDKLIEELHSRGVGIEQIFALYYTLEEMATGKEWQHNGTGEEGQHGRPPLTVGDAHLAGFKGEPPVNLDKPF